MYVTPVDSMRASVFVVYMLLLPADRHAHSNKLSEKLSEKSHTEGAMTAGYEECILTKRMSEVEMCFLEMMFNG